jgi:hypothetical protein
MTRAPLKDLDDSQLVQLFEEVCLAQDRALRNEDTRKYNDLFEQLIDLSDELRRRPGDQRRALTSLYGHHNSQVRVKAAIHTLATNRREARLVLQMISDRNEYPQAVDARSTMRGLDDGSYAPT